MPESGHLHITVDHDKREARATREITSPFGTVTIGGKEMKVSNIVVSRPLAVIFLPPGESSPLEQP